MRRVGFALLVSVLWVISGQLTAHALSSDSKLFISGDNTFYAYVQAGETISAAFTRVDQDEPFDTVRGDVTVTIAGPDVATQSCIMKANVPFGQGCSFAAQVAPKSGIWQIQFMAPAGAKPYLEASPTVKWGKNLFSWTINVDSGTTEQHGRIWTEQYAIRQPADPTYADDLNYFYVSEDGYIYKSTEFGYNGQISTLSADSIGIRSGTSCVSAYQSTDVSNTNFTPALGTCGNAYKLFFESPAGDLPTAATQWDGKSDWVLPNVSHPAVSGLKFTSDNSQDQQSGRISFYLKNFIGQYQIKIDADGDGNFDGQSDVTLNEQMKSLSNGLQKVYFQGADKQGQVIPTSQPIGIQVNITKVAEIHLIAADVEGRSGGVELTRLNGDNAPTTRICWNDTQLEPIADQTLNTPTLDGRDCPDSTGGVHGWPYGDASWGNDRYIDDWTYASAKLTGTNQISYPDATTKAAVKRHSNLALIVALVGGLGIILIVAFVLIAKRRKNVPPAPPLPPSGTPIQPYQQQPQSEDPPVAEN